MKKIILVISLFLLVLCCSCSSNKRDDITICEEISMMEYFYEENGIVHIICTISINNASNDDVDVRIIAVSQEDVEGGLLVDPRMEGINTDTQSTIFTVKSAQCAEFTIDFQGAYGGICQKVDRLLPDVLEIEIVE